MQHELLLDHFYIGDVLEKIKLIPDKSVRCIVTSPPYYGLRDYTTATWQGGDQDCDHLRINVGKNGSSLESAMVKSNLLGGKATQEDAYKSKKSYSGVCGKCGAIRIDKQIGLEKTPELYIEKMVQVFRECRRILKDDGSLWLNIGDSYWGGKGQSGDARPDIQAQRLADGKSFQRVAQNIGEKGVLSPLQGKHSVIKPKDLIGIPWLLAFALRADGWWLRSDIIWHKPSTMPESVKDRPTRSHEHIFLLTKSKKYFYDYIAILQEASENTHARLSQDIQNQVGSERANGNTRADRPMKAMGRKFDPGPNNKNNPSFDQAMAIMPIKVNKRDVWSISPKPFSDAHFATFPEDLIVDCIKAGTSEHGQCSNCGKPWVRIVERESEIGHTGESETKYDGKSTAVRLAKLRQAARENGQEYSSDYKTIGWEPTCKCNAAVIPDVVFDPFGGAGTTPLVAKKLNRNFVAIELNETYVKDIAIPRLKRELGMFYQPQTDY